MFSKLGNKFKWFSKPAPPTRLPYTPNPKEFVLIVLAVIVGVVFQSFAPILIGKLKKYWKFGSNNLCNESQRDFIDFRVSRKIAKETNNPEVADFNYEKGSEDNTIEENSSKIQLRKLRSRKRQNYTK